MSAINGDPSYMKFLESQLQRALNSISHVEKKLDETVDYFEQRMDTYEQIIEKLTIHVKKENNGSGYRKEEEINRMEYDSIRKIDDIDHEFNSYKEMNERRFLEIEEKVETSFGTKHLDKKQDKQISQLKNAYEQLDKRVQNDLEFVAQQFEQFSTKTKSKTSKASLSNEIVQRLADIEKKLHNDMEKQAKYTAADIIVVEKKIDLLINTNKSDSYQSSSNSELASIKTWVNEADRKFKLFENTLTFFQNKIENNQYASGENDKSQSKKPFQVDRADLKIFENQLLSEIDFLREEFETYRKQSTANFQDFESKLALIDNDRKPAKKLNSSQNTVN
jgi:hypothetical protein